MPLSTGDKLGPYEIVSLLGAGGMGEVYKARDTRLDRLVAVKIAQAEFSERFEKEARAVAALNHNNIAALYDVGPNYLVMEYVDGPMLADRIRHGALPLDESLAITRQLIDAIEAAHEKGITHRDLKPENIKITLDGIVKVLDFGLAKAADPVAAIDPGAAPTIKAGTIGGLIMGTPGYMAPEQARGLTVDKRADIWAFGVILHEMSTGKRLFDGETVSDTLAAVLTKDPDTAVLPLTTRRLVQRCLQKDPKKRLRDIGDARHLLDEEQSPVATARGSKWLPWVAAATTAGLLAALGVIWFLTRPVEQPLTRLDITLGTNASSRGDSISPDGRRIAFVAENGDGKYSLLTRRLDQATPTVLAADVEHAATFFSPDSKWIGYVTRDGKLKKIPVEGGAPIMIHAPMLTGNKSVWLDNGDIISPLTFTGLWHIPSAGGETRFVIKERFGFFAGLPGSASILISSARGISIVSVPAGETKALTKEPALQVKYVPTGHILSLAPSAVLSAIPFDVRRQEVKGPAIPLVEDVASFDVSNTGTLLFREEKQRLITVQWLDASGNMQPVIDKPGVYGNLAFSPDGKRLALTVRDGKRNNFWVWDMERRSMARLTFEEEGQAYPVWHPDGRMLFYAGERGIYAVRSDGGGKPRLILEGKSHSPRSISPDGRTLAVLRPGRERDIVFSRLEGSGENIRAAPPVAVLDTEADEISPALSPDGKWLAYSSSESGTFIVYVRPANGSGAKWQVSTKPAFKPVWAPGGGVLYMSSLRGTGLFSARYSAKGDVFIPEPAVAFSPQRQIVVGGESPVFSVSPGNRVAALISDSETHGQRDGGNLVLILNFFDEIKRRAAQHAVQ